MKTTRLVDLSHGRNMKAARVVLSPGEEVGEHVTEKREEVIIVLKGEGVLLKDGEETRLAEGDVHYIRENTRHNVKSGSGTLEYVYVVNFLRPPA